MLKTYLFNSIEEKVAHYTKMNGGKPPRNHLGEECTVEYYYKIRAEIAEKLPAYLKQIEEEDLLNESTSDYNC